jgi:hypothetical protein
MGRVGSAIPGKMAPENSVKTEVKYICVERLCIGFGEAPNEIRVLDDGSRSGKDESTATNLTEPVTNSIMML